jgi:hypothetical protein
MPNPAFTQQQCTTIISQNIIPDALPQHTAHTFCYVRHVYAALTNTSHVPKSEFWRLSIRMQRGQELKCQGHSIPSYFALPRDVPHTAGTASQCVCSYVQELIAAQQLLCVYRDLWPPKKSVPEYRHTVNLYISYNSQKNAPLFPKIAPTGWSLCPVTRIVAANSTEGIMQISVFFTGFKQCTLKQSLLHVQDETGHNPERMDCTNYCPDNFTAHSDCTRYKDHRNYNIKKYR